MGFAILDSSSLDKDKWAKLVTASESSTFYHTLDWSLVWEKSYDFCRSLFFVEEKNYEYSLGLPAVKFKKKGLESFFSMPMGTYGGVLSQDSTESKTKEFLNQALDSIKSLKCLKLQLVDFNGRLSFLGRDNFRPHQASTHIVELGRVNPDELLTKRGYQQAEHRNVTARRIENETEVRRCYDLYLKTCQRHNRPPKYSQSFFQNLFRTGNDSNWLWWWVAEGEGRMVGYQINFSFKDRLYMWDMASEPESLNLRANDYLMGQSLKWCHQHGISSYNLGSSPTTAEGLVHFKEQWGGEEKKYYIYEKTFMLGKLVDLIRGR